MHSIYSHFLHRSGTLVLTGFIVAILSGGATFLFPLEYRADAQILIIARGQSGVDPYTVVKSSERIGENLAKVLGTNDFWQKVMAEPGYRIDQTKFQNVAERTKRKRWQKTVSASMVYGTGLLNVSAYSVTPDQAIQLAGAATTALVGSGSEYMGSDVAMKIVNDPVATQFPVRPNLIVNIIAGFAAGVILAGLAVARKRPHLLS